MTHGVHDAGPDMFNAKMECQTQSTCLVHSSSLQPTTRTDNFLFFIHIRALRLSTPTDYQQLSSSSMPEPSTCSPSQHTFSFSAPPPSSSSSSTLKQRRVSLALPSSPRLVPACNFRDDTGLTFHTESASMPERKGKLRKIADDSVSQPLEGGLVIQQKKQRKKWSEEETQMLVTGCNTVRALQSLS